MNQYITIKAPYVQAPLRDKIIILGEEPMLYLETSDDYNQLKLEGFRRGSAYVSVEYGTMIKYHLGFRLYFEKNNCIPIDVYKISNLAGYENVTHRF